jgi:hypothetical protein
MKVTIDQLIKRLQAVKRRTGGDAVVLVYDKNLKDKTIEHIFFRKPIGHFVGTMREGELLKHNVQIPLVDAHNDEKFI